jgi:predicted dehydrogenase
MVIRTGIIGFSEGNGHPFSFSAIVNGYNESAFADAGWPVILDYLRRQPSENFGIGDARVTHAWTQDPALTQKLCSACRIENACIDVSEMLGSIDALIIARDDWETHARLAMPFLRSGIPVFVDKPLTLDVAELAEFTPYLESGRLMSCSGLRYAAEIDPLRLAAPATGSIRLIAGTVLNGLEKYGIHLIEAVASLGGAYTRPVAITRLQAPHDSFLLHFENGVPFRLDCLGNVGKTFHVSVFGDRGHVHFDLHDNFSAFRRTLQHFFTMVRSGVPSITAAETVLIMRLLSASATLAPGSTFRLGL